jgi:hypothetical protein
MSTRFVQVTLIAAGFAWLTACSDTPSAVSAKTDQPAAESPVTGKTAFWEMYKLAHAWSPDVQVLWLKSSPLPDVPVKDGKAPVWTAMFVSATKKQAHDFTYHAFTRGTQHKGVISGEAQTWLGPVPKGQPFPSAELRTDSDAAYASAAQAIEKWLKDNPDKELHIVLGKESKYPAPVWSFYWGDDKKPLAALMVNTEDGSVIKK